MSTREVGIRPEDDHSFAFMYYFSCGLHSQRPIKRMALDRFRSMHTAKDIEVARQLLAQSQEPKQEQYVRIFEARLRRINQSLTSEHPMLVAA